MNKTLLNVLTNIGLTQKESAVYLASLQLGPASVSEIARQSGLNRVSCYDILKTLQTHGYVSEVMDAKVKHFQALPPKLILNELKQKQKRFERNLNDFEKLQRNIQHPRVRYFEGIQAVKKLYADTLNSKTEILNYANSKMVREIWPEYDQEYVAERVQRNIWLRGIAPKDELGKHEAEKNKERHREIRLVDPKNGFNFSNEINIYDNKIAIISFENTEVLGTLIESASVAETQRAIFMMAWAFAAPNS